MRISDWSSDVCSSDLLANSNIPLTTAVSFPLPSATRVSRLLRARCMPLVEGSGTPRPRRDRTSVVSGKSVSVRVDLGGRRIIKKKIKHYKTTHNKSLQQKDIIVEERDYNNRHI